MNKLLSIRTNIIYLKNKKDEFIKMNELIFLIQSPKYYTTRENDVVKDSEVKEFRFTVSEKFFDSMIEFLSELRKSNETDLI